MRVIGLAGSSDGGGELRFGLLGPQFHNQTGGDDAIQAPCVRLRGTATEYTANFDGKDYPLTGSQIANTVSLRRINSRITIRTDKKDGKVIQTLTRIVSEDGKTLIVWATGTNAQGNPIDNVAVWEKQ